MDKLHKRSCTLMTKKHSENPSTSAASSSNNERSDAQELVIEGEPPVPSDSSVHLKNESKLLLPMHDEMRASVKPAVSHIEFHTFYFVNLRVGHLRLGRRQMPLQNRVPPATLPRPLCFSQKKRSGQSKTSSFDLRSHVRLGSSSCCHMLLINAL